MSAALAWMLASQVGCDPAIVCAICEQESDWNPWAIRWEQLFYDRYVKPQVLARTIRDITEAKARAFSWGLMQVMGQVAREHHYQGPLAMLCDAETGLKVGMAVWKKKLEATEGDVEKALQLWNGGGNPNYATQVLARVSKYAGTPAVKGE
jgi:soluble lytic murein transglycosylase-like protein